jgi:hypothetical protein
MRNHFGREAGSLIMNNLPGAVKRSGGPRTAAGKAASAYNALKFGAYTRNVFIDGESQQDFDRLKQALFDELQPQMLVQYALAEDVLTQLWRKFRIERYASNTLKEIAEREIGIADLIRDLGVEASDVVSSAKRITDAIRENGVDYYQLVLTKIQTAQYLYPKHCPDFTAFQQDHFEVYQLMRKRSWHPEHLDKLITKNEADSSGKTFWERELQSLGEWAEDWIRCFDCEVRLSKSIPRIINGRLYRHLISGDTDRATDDVTRALHRALAEYYKERDRHRKDTAIVLDREVKDAEEHRDSGEGSDTDLVPVNAA